MCEIARNSDPLRAVFASNRDPSALCVSVSPYGRAPNGFFPQVNGGGFEVLVCFVFLFLFFAGPGPWSVDATRRPTAKI